MNNSTKQRIDVFVSSTSSDLKAYRRAVRTALIERGLHPVMMEDFPAVSRDAVETCRSYVDSSDLFIGIYAYRYGYCPNDDEISITEMEYDWAKAKGIARLVFVIDEDADLPDSDPVYTKADTRGSDSNIAKIREKLVAFLDRVGKEVVWKKFTTPDDLSRKVMVALAAWEKENSKGYVQSRSRLSEILLWITTLVGFFVLLASILWLLRVSRFRVSAMMLALVGAVLLGLPLFTHYQWRNLFSNSLRRWGLVVSQMIITTLIALSARSIIVPALNLEIEEAIANRDSIRVQSLIPGVAILAPSITNTNADLWNDRAVEAFVMDDSNLANVLWNAVRAIDESPFVNRSIEQESTTLYNLGVVSEQNHSLENPAAVAAAWYRQAIAINPGNIDTYYALSSLLLTSSNEDVGALENAASIAATGRDMLPDDCMMTSSALQQSSFETDWTCFLLFTTEAGARYLLGEPDIVVGGLIERALVIADANNQFGSAYYTAEVYYWSARLSENDTPVSVLCSIVVNHDPTNTRHREWVSYAHEQLADTKCLAD